MSDLVGNHIIQGSHRLEKYLGRLEKSLKTKFALKSAWKLSIDLERYLIFIFSCVLDSCQTAGNNLKVIF